MTFKTILFGAASALVLSAGAANAVPATAENSLNVRSGPGTQYEVVGTIRAGETVDAGNCTGSWCRVSFSGGTGFANRSYLAMGGGGPAVAVAPGYAYSEPYDDDYYDYGYGYGPSVGLVSTRAPAIAIATAGAADVTGKEAETGPVVRAVETGPDAPAAETGLAGRVASTRASGRAA